MYSILKDIHGTRTLSNCRIIELLRLVLNISNDEILYIQSVPHDNTLEVRMRGCFSGFQVF